MTARPTTVCRNAFLKSHGLKERRIVRFRVMRTLLGWNGEEWVTLGTPADSREAEAIAERAWKDGYKRVVIMRNPGMKCSS